MIRCGGCIIWLKIARWYGMFQYIRSVRVEYVVGISSVTTLYIRSNVFENVRNADRQTDRFAFPKTETQFYNLGIPGRWNDKYVNTRCLLHGEHYTHIRTQNQAPWLSQRPMCEAPVLLYGCCTAVARVLCTVAPRLLLKSQGRALLLEPWMLHNIKSSSSKQQCGVGTGTRQTKADTATADRKADTAA